MIDIIIRQTTDYGEHEVDIQTKKKQLIQKLLSGDVVIIYNSKEESCDIVRAEDFQSFQKMVRTSAF